MVRLVLHHTGPLNEEPVKKLQVYVCRKRLLMFGDTKKRQLSLCLMVP